MGGRYMVGGVCCGGVQRTYTRLLSNPQLARLFPAPPLTPFHDALSTQHSQQSTADSQPPLPVSPPPLYPPYIYIYTPHTHQPDRSRIPLPPVAAARCAPLRRVRPCRPHTASPRAQATPWPWGTTAGTAAQQVAHTQQGRRKHWRRGSRRAKRPALHAVNRASETGRHSTSPCPTRPNPDPVLASSDTGCPHPLSPPVYVSGPS